MEKQQKQSIAVIVGVGPGLGASLAKKFANQGHKIALVSRTKKKIGTIANAINQAGGNAHCYTADVSDLNSIQSAFNKINKQLGHSSILIYNASGSFQMNGILDIKPEDFIASWQITCYGALVCAQQVLPAMVEKQQGTILITGATASLRGGAKLASFAAGKFSLRALAQSMAREFGPQGVHVAHIIIDGLIATPLALEKFPNKPKHTFLDPDAIAKAYWQLHQQDQTCWTQELDIRPFVEKF